MAGIKEMRDELLGLLDEQLGFLDRSDHLTMPASPGFPATYLFYLGFSAPLRWRVAERVDAAWLAMQPRIRRANAPRVLVGCGAVSAIRRCSGTAPPAPQLWPRSGCRPVDQLDLEGRRFVDHACPTKYACIAVANSSAESPARFTGQLCHNSTVSADRGM